MENKHNTIEPLCPNEVCIKARNIFEKQKSQLYDLQEIKKSSVAQIEKLSSENKDFQGSLNRMKLEASFKDKGGKIEYLDDYISLTKGESLSWDEGKNKDFKVRWSNMFEKNSTIQKSSISTISGEAGKETKEPNSPRVVFENETLGDIRN